MSLIAAAIIIGTGVTAGVSIYNQKKQQKIAEQQMAQQRQMANEQVRMQEEKVQGQAVRSANRAERQARGAYGRSDQIGVGGQTNDLIGGLLGGDMTLGEAEQRRSRGTLLGE